jgi:hypothetical protein
MSRRAAGSHAGRSASLRVRVMSGLGISPRFWCPRGDLNPCRRVASDSMR